MHSRLRRLHCSGKTVGGGGGISGARETQELLQHEHALAENVGATVGLLSARLELDVEIRVDPSKRCHLATLPRATLTVPTLGLRHKSQIMSARLLDKSNNTNFDDINTESNSEWRHSVDVTWLPRQWCNE